RDRTVRVWEAVTGRQLHLFQEPNVEYHSAAFSPDGKELAVSGGDLVRGQGTAVHLLDLTTGKEVRRLSGIDRRAYHLAYSPDGATLLAAGADQVVCWETATARCLHQWKHPQAASILAFAADRRTLVSAGCENDDTSIQIRDAATGWELRRIYGPK